MARTARASGPRNSLGRPWNGETWSCTRCGETGPDRDDLPRSAHAPHTLAFHPAEHHAAIIARRAA